MAKLKVHQNGKVREAESDLGEILLNTLRNNGFDIYAPCGGNGTCGKCKVLIKGEGIVTSCIFTCTIQWNWFFPTVAKQKY